MDKWKGRRITHLNFGVAVIRGGRAVTEIAVDDCIDANEKLYDYEETNLTPAEIAALKAENERLKSILEAKVLYGYDKKKNKVDKLTGIKIEFHCKRIQEIEGEKVKCGTWVNYPQDFGKSIFFTREEAEAKLKEKP